MRKAEVPQALAIIEETLGEFVNGINYLCYVFWVVK